jgi:hypothetical protein
MRARIALLPLIVLTGLLFYISAPVRSVSISAPKQPVPATFFGLHIHHLNSGTPWPVIPFGTWRLWDAHAAWIDLEPQPGKWNFEKLDGLIAAAEEHQISVLMPLGTPPQWASARPAEPGPYGPGTAAEPARIEDWRNYVRTVATRYKGRIHYYELWNEANADFFTGRVDTLLQLSREAYTILKEIDPGILVVSPSGTAGEHGVKWLSQYLVAGGGESADIIGFHFYVSPRPELLIGLIRHVEYVMRQNGLGDKPLWNTETGWLIQNHQNDVAFNPSYGPVLNQQQAAAYLARAFLLGWASGLQRFYWYAWDNWNMGLTEPGGKVLKAPALAYGEVEDWLLGAVMNSCTSDEAGTWTCEISRGGGYRAWVLWNPWTFRRFTPPATWNISQVRELSGAVHKLVRDEQSVIGPSPSLFENRSH